MGSRQAATEREGWRGDLEIATPDLRLQEERIISLSDAVRRATRARDRALDLYVSTDDDVEQPVLKSQYERRRNALRQLVADLAASEQAYEDAQGGLATAGLSTDELREVLRGWQDFPAEARREVLSIVIDRAILGPRPWSPRGEPSAGDHSPGSQTPPATRRVERSASHETPVWRISRIDLQYRAGAL